MLIFQAKIVYFSACAVLAATGASNGSCSDVMTLLIRDCLFLEDGTIPLKCTLHFLSQVSNKSATSSYI